MFGKRRINSVGGKLRQILDEDRHSPLQLLIASISCLGNNVAFG
jgi:hypothetical protein